MPLFLIVSMLVHRLALPLWCGLVIADLRANLSKDGDAKLPAYSAMRQGSGVANYGCKLHGLMN
jgi:hypothetical protein